MNSILDDVKKLVGLTSDNTAFDNELILYINSAFSTLQQLGVGPTAGFEITNGLTDWSAYGENNNILGHIKTYLGYKVRLAFDVPKTSFAIEAIQKQIIELEWRINTEREETRWTPPMTPDPLTSPTAN